MCMSRSTASEHLKKILSINILDQNTSLFFNVFTALI